MATLRAALVSASWLGLWLATASWAQPVWEPSPPFLDRDTRPFIGRDPREGRIEATHFVASSQAAVSLGRGTIDVFSGADTMAIGAEEGSYRAAVAEQLAKAGYTTSAEAPAAQLAEVSVRHALVQPPELPHSPLGGEVAVGGGNHGGGVGVAIALDFSTPRKALIATRLEARIRDRVTKDILWEGHAQVLTREETSTGVRRRWRAD